METIYKQEGMSTFFDIPYSSQQPQGPYTNTPVIEVEEEDLPILEELGIDPVDCVKRVLSVLNPMERGNPEQWQEGDLSGFLIFIISFCFLLLLKGRIHFGYVFGFSIIGSLLLYFLLNLMSISRGSSLTAYNVVSILGYSLFPLLLLTLFSVFFNLSGFFGIIITIIFVSWCTFSGTSTLIDLLGYGDIKYLVAYPLFLFFFTFALNTIF
ncbi:MAG: putative protein YIPF5 [Streblomastix strix]|uniref:Protein YIPF n=1 Tax=Streblomastix strix TaxID=222440 RepID=A0A5J4WWQ7_9EUKA|nr:MAG: putative protein YIPF5 [Streblomastix strix]